MSLHVAETRRTFPKSVQPGIPKITPPQAGAKRYTFGDLFKVVQRPVKLNDDKEYDLVTVKRARGGIEHRARMKGSQVAVKSQFYLEEGDFLISKRQIVHGACGIVSGDFTGSIVSNEYSVLRCKPEIDLQFLGYLSHSIYFQQTCFHSSIGVHIEKMIFKLDDWFKWPINLPSLPEQKKIAAFLGVVDAKIAALRARRAGLERYKRGLMQALFSQVLRFTRSDGTAFPDWEEKRLGDFITVFSGGTPSASVARYYSGEIPFIKSGEIGKAQTAQFLSQEGFDSSSSKMVEVGDLLYALYGATTGEVRISRVAGAINQAVLCIRTKQSKSFLLHWLGHNKEPLKAKFLQGGQGNFSADIVKRVKISLPHPDEQAKIAEALSAMDAKIAAVGDQVAQMEAFKKGLLQQMFV